VLYQHPSVTECAVVGQPDATKGERVIAYVRLKPADQTRHAESSLRTHCETRLARYKWPDTFIFDREIPKSPAGKILKRLLRDQLDG
jgi:acyl-coenzyme A synthetase/AMP-(fatty) acid ligase